MAKEATAYNEFFIKTLEKKGLLPFINQVFQTFIPERDCLTLFKMLDKHASSFNTAQADLEKIKAVLDVMIFFLPIKHNAVFASTLQDEALYQRVDGFSKSLLEKGFLMVDEKGIKKENPLYQLKAEALLHLARLQNLIDKNLYFSALGALGLMESYSKHLPKRENHKISYASILSYCDSHSIKHPELFCKIVRRRLTGEWSDSQEAMTIDQSYILDLLDSRNQFFIDIIFTQNMIEDICKVMNISTVELLKVLERYEYRVLGEIIKGSYSLNTIQSVVIFSKEFHGQYLEQLREFYRFCKGACDSELIEFFRSHMHPKNFSPVYPNITGFNFKSEPDLSKEAYTYIKAIFNYFKLDEAQQLSLKTELLSLPDVSSTCYKLTQLGDESRILKTVAMPWLCVEKENFYFPSMMVFYIIMKHVTQGDSKPKPTQFVTGMVGTNLQDEMMKAGFRPTYNFSLFAKRNPYRAHKYLIKPCMYTMHDLFYHLPKFFVSESYHNSLAAFSNGLHVALEKHPSKKEEIKKCIDLFNDGDLSIENSKFFKNQKLTEMSLIILIATLKPLLAQVNTDEKQQTTLPIVQNLASFLDFSELSLEQCFSCLSYAFPPISGVFAENFRLNYTDFWRLYFNKYHAPTQTGPSVVTPSTTNALQNK